LPDRIAPYEVAALRELRVRVGEAELRDAAAIEAVPEKSPTSTTILGSLANFRAIATV
jgi:hypothetical protein